MVVGIATIALVLGMLIHGIVDKAMDEKPVERASIVQEVGAPE